MWWMRRELVGWIFQDFHLLDNLTAIDNVAMALELSGMGSQEAEDAAKAALMKVGLGDRMHFIPDQLSGGQQQRLQSHGPLPATGQSFGR